MTVKTADFQDGLNKILTPKNGWNLLNGIYDHIFHAKLYLDNL